MPDPILTALVIGNAAYSNVDRLQNPVNDAEDISLKLTDLGFSVRTLTDATVNQMRDALVAFEAALQIMVRLPYPTAFFLEFRTSADGLLML